MHTSSHITMLDGQTFKEKEKVSRLTHAIEERKIYTRG